MTVVLAEVNNEPVVPHAAGDVWEIRCGLTFSSTYKTGGDASLLTALEAIMKEQGSGTVIWIDVQGMPGYTVVYNYETSKLQFFESGSNSKHKELAEGEYPAEIRNAKARVFAMCK